MATDIAAGASAPVFYYGVEYGGALEPWILAGAYRLFGPSTQGYRALMLLMLAGVVAALWGAGRVAAGPRAGNLVGVVAAFAPAYLYYKVLTSDGAYASLTLAGALSILAVAMVEARACRGAPLAGGVFALWLSLGVAFWIHLASLPYLVAGFAATIAWFARRRAGPAYAVVAIVGFALGSLPWWLRNAATGFASLALPEASPAPTALLTSRIVRLFTESLPVLLGPSSFRGPSAALPIAGLVVAGALAVLADAARRAGRRDIDGSVHLSRVTLVLVGASLAAFLAAKNTSPWEPRYLLPALLGLLLLTGLSIAEALEAPGPRLALVVIPLLLAITSHFRAPQLRDFQRRTSDDPADRRIVFARAGDLLDALSARGVGAVYGSYWVVYRLVFLSAGGLVGSPFGRIAVDRMPGLSKSADLDPAPAFVLDGADLEDMEAWLASRGAGVERTRVGDLVIFTGLPAGAVAELRLARRVPRP